SNQDTVGCFPELQLAIVADGMGGGTDGEVASRLAVDTIHETLRTGRRSWRSVFGGRTASGRSASEQLRAAIELANQRIFEASLQRPGALAPMGTTVVALLCVLDDRTAYWAHVGDSRLYRVRNRELSLLTADHTQ